MKQYGSRLVSACKRAMTVSVGVTIGAVLIPRLSRSGLYHESGRQLLLLCVTTFFVSFVGSTVTFWLIG